ncbi:hypothetical protein WMY93_002597 [Mugilogobius chulae]|uniref:Oxysterol-binding protein n=1 Tax=Mugilogobius chulae TaxID=88201 RepID=A0AAW0Q043_9GOBI
MEQILCEINMFTLKFFWLCVEDQRAVTINSNGAEADSWEIIEGLKIGQSNVLRPDKHEGFMLKKRKWPLKGWHKRFFVLDNGILKYSKSPLDIQKGKLHGSIDVGLSVMSIKKRSRRIDLDTEEHIYHLKVKSQDIFDAWVAKLRHHRLYRQNEIVRSPREATMRTFPPSTAIESPQNVPTLGYEAKSKPSSLPWQPVAPSNSSNSSLPASYSNGQSKVAVWLQESEEMDKCAEGPSVRSMSPVRLHSSNPNLCAELADYQPPATRLTESVDYTSDYIKLQEEFCTIAQKVHSLLKSAFNTVAIEKEKIKQILANQEQTDQITSLRKSLSQAVSQNAELRSRLNRIHSESVLTEQVVSVNIISTPDEAGEQMGIPLTQQASNESRLSMSESVSEFFDAQEVLLSASSSENEGSDDESYVSDVSDNISEDNASVTDNVSRQMANGDFAGSAFRNGRRSCLPAPCPDTSNINLWNILRNNIGKDLSKVSMPVELNEPLNTLQRMCEELEYSELLDKAAETQDPFERMVLVAAFAVSGYSSTYYRAGSKPFNPLLGETYECIREDKGFCFFSEQVSHHPPVSACHCESKNFTFWQGSMPTDYELYYGFTRFAIELNELCPELKDALPRTDARFRPDQRYLEEGNLEMAASEKQRIEDLQRARRNGTRRIISNRSRAFSKK